MSHIIITIRYDLSTKEQPQELTPTIPGEDQLAGGGKQFAEVESGGVDSSQQLANRVN